MTNQIDRYYSNECYVDGRVIVVGNVNSNHNKGYVWLNKEPAFGYELKNCYAENKSLNEKINHARVPNSIDTIFRNDRTRKRIFSYLPLISIFIGVITLAEANRGSLTKKRIIRALLQICQLGSLLPIINTITTIGRRHFANKAISQADQDWKAEHARQLRG